MKLLEKQVVDLKVMSFSAQHQTEYSDTDVQWEKLFES